MRLCWTLSVLHNTPPIHWRWLRMCLISVSSAPHAVGCPKVLFCWYRCFLRSDLRFSLQILLHTRLRPSFHWRKFTLGSLDPASRIQQLIRKTYGITQGLRPQYWLTYLQTVSMILSHPCKAASDRVHSVSAQSLCDVRLVYAWWNRKWHCSPLSWAHLITLDWWHVL